MPILSVPTTACDHLRGTSITPWVPDIDLPLAWHDRAALETDPTWQQIIPYAVLVDLQDRPWAYRRTGGDPRLQERRSIGVGGHVEQEDDRGGLLATARAALARELAEELQEFPQQMTAHALPVAWIHERDSAVGRVHLGLVFVIPWGLANPPRPRPGEGLAGLGFVAPASITTAQGYETWSVLALKALELRP